MISSNFEIKSTSKVIIHYRNSERTDEEQAKIREYLISRVKYFTKNFSYETIKEIASKLTAEFYNK
jgi:hypothetical protein